jgi:phosphatidylserine decarboxylase
MIHREGWPTIIITFVFSAIITFSAHYFLGEYFWIKVLSWTLSIFLLITVLQFFRNPKRTTELNENDVIAPADGKVVVIEEITDPEYFHDRRMQVSIFMSPINVHVNRFPISGTVKYAKYHPGLYLVAWHPKSSTENERTTVVVEHPSGKEVLFRQIAGALARRIVYYCKPGEKAQQGAEFGFIKFGSRVDILLPLDTKVTVTLGQKVVGGKTVIAQFS